MDITRHLVPILVVVVHGVIFTWLWRRPPLAQAKFEPGRIIFAPRPEIRFLLLVSGAVSTALVIVSLSSLGKPRQAWVPFLFLGFLALVAFAYPPVLTIEVDGITSRTWFGGEKKIRWEEIASLSYNTRAKQLTVKATDGRKITHAYHAAPVVFLSEIRKRTHLPVKIALTTKNVEIPYEGSKRGPGPGAGPGL